MCVLHRTLLSRSEQILDPPFDLQIAQRSLARSAFPEMFQIVEMNIHALRSEV